MSSLSYSDHLSGQYSIFDNYGRLFEEKGDKENFAVVCADKNLQFNIVHFLLHFFAGCQWCVGHNNWVGVLGLAFTLPPRATSIKKN